MGLRKRYEAIPDIEKDPVQEALLEPLEEFCQIVFLHHHKKRFWFKPNPPQGIYLWGDVGRGKTFLMNLVCDELSSTLKTHRTHTHHWIKNLSEGGLPSERRAWAKQFVRATPLLFLDEIEITHIADGILFQNALDALFHAGIILLATSNTPPEGLYRKGLNRELLGPLWEKLRSHLTVIPFSGGFDHRHKISSSRDHRFSFSGEITPQALTDIWNQLTGGAPFCSDVLRIGSRTLSLRRTHPNVVWLTFDEACRQPLGIADYQKILATFPNIILSGFSREHLAERDGIRRLIIFIDQLYNRRRSLLFSSDLSLEAMGEAIGESPAFARTLSRLAEMQTWPLDLTSSFHP